jgi:hypothetical protein
MHGSTPQAPVINVISVMPVSCHVHSMSPAPQALSKPWSCHALQTLLPRKLLCVSGCFRNLPALSLCFSAYASHGLFLDCSPV